MPPTLSTSPTGRTQTCCCPGLSTSPCCRNRPTSSSEVRLTLAKVKIQLLQKYWHRQRVACSHGGVLVCLQCATHCNDGMMRICSTECIAALRMHVQQFEARPALQLQPQDCPCSPWPSDVSRLTTYSEQKNSELQEASLSHSPARVELRHDWHQKLNKFAWT